MNLRCRSPADVCVCVGGGVFVCVFVSVFVRLFVCELCGLQTRYCRIFPELGQVARSVGLLPSTLWEGMSSGF